MSLPSLPKGYTLSQTPRLSPSAQQNLNQLREGLSPYLGRSLDILGQQASGDTSANQAYLQNQMRQFNENILPNILQRFGSFGSGKNSGLQNALGVAGANLGSTLAERRENLQQRSLMDLLALQERLIGVPEVDYQLMANSPKQPSKLMQLLSAIAAPTLGAAGSAIGGGAGGALMSLLSSLLGS